MSHLSDKILKELIIITGVLISAFLLFSTYDVLEAIVAFSQRHEKYEIDEILSTLVVFAFCMILFSWRRIKDAETSRMHAELKNNELQQALTSVKTLQGVLPTCCYCNKIRDDQGVWSDPQVFINSHLDTEFSQGACPDCFDLRMQELKEPKAEHSLSSEIPTPA